VLSENTTTGALPFQLAIAVHVSRLTLTLRICTDDDKIIATGIHRFWMPGRGWTMARELKTGDCVRAVGGTVEVLNVETDSTQPVYNLDVAENGSFFVGTTALLVYHFSFVQAVPSPFDQLEASRP
jgi:hypothetical protein